MFSAEASPAETPHRLVRLAEEAGARPVLFVCGLVVLVLAGYALAWGAAIFSSRHARRLWSWAQAKWKRLAETAPVTALRDRFPAVWRAMRWLTASEYIVLHAALGFVAIASVLVFAELAEVVTPGHAMADVDLALATALHASASPATIAVLRRFTDLGDFGGLTALTAVGSIALLVARRRVLALGWILGMIGCALLNQGLKSWFVRARPSFADPFVIASGWSFPSGHSMGTFVLAGLATFVTFHFVRSAPRRVAIALVATVWTVVMGYSRMVLGAHYLTDVLAGFVAGAAWLSICVSGLVVAQARTRSALRAGDDPAPAADPVPEAVAEDPPAK